MPDSSPAPAPVVSSALSAFLRGIERRAYVFAQVQCGQERDAEAALGRTLHAFQSLSAMSPLSAWPAGFWALLLAQPELSAGDGSAPELKTLGSGPRAALLLRLVGGLDFVHAAQVLGVSEQTYRFALQRALQQLGDGGVSYAQLRTLRERLHRQVKTLPDERTAALADLRQRALAGSPAPERAPPPPRRPRWLLPVLWGLLAALGVAFAATFLEPAPTLAPGGTEGLPEEAVPAAAPALAPSDVVMHPDYAQLADPEAAKVAEDVALLSWLANHPEELAEADAAAATADPPADAAPGADAPSPPETPDAD